jgi:hypothetical protein
MTQPDMHDQSADALKAMATGEHKPQAGSADGFVGADPPEESEDGGDAVHDAVHDAVVAVAGTEAVPSSVPPAAAEAFAPDLAARRRHTAAFNQREKLAHAHQYKTIMIPLLLTLGAVLLLMGAYALIRGGTIQVETADGVVEQPAPAMQRWFPMMAFPLAIILMAGAWLFHKDVNTKRR